jgi:solute carrier family 36 (proton-coupled amino acid transporter)
MSSSRDVPVPSGSGSSPIPTSSPRSRGRLSPQASYQRSTARLASPVPGGQTGSPPPSIPNIPPQSQLGSSQGTNSPLPGVGGGKSSLPGPGASALAAAFHGSGAVSPPRFGTPPIQPLFPSAAATGLQGNGLPIQSNYGSFDTRSIQGSPGWTGQQNLEDPEVVRRHLVQGNKPSTSNLHDKAQSEEQLEDGEQFSHNTYPAPGLDEDEFSSLQLQGGDITREIYRWSEQAEAEGRGRAQRSKSFHLSRPHPEDETMDVGNIRLPGGFRRDYIRRAAGDKSPSPVGRAGPSNSAHPAQPVGKPKLLTNNFIEFLTLYGHFAGEELEEDDEVLGPDEYFGEGSYGRVSRDLYDGHEDEEDREDESLLRPETPGLRKRKQRSPQGTNGAWGATMLLLKSFVGTGVLFMPRAYLNGGMLFSNLVLLGVAGLSFYCFVLLVNVRLKVNGSFGDMGGILYGRKMRALILSSIVLSQIGFAAAYIVFTSENLQAFVLAVSNCKTHIPIKYMIAMQLVVFLPLSLVRDISKLGGTALVADAFILAGLVYLYYYDIFTIVHQGGVSDIVNFNPMDWTLFIGTAIFTFEGIGLIIPIQESMKKPKQFPSVLGGVMIVITIIFVSMGALSYAAYGSATKTVVILNLPQDDKFVNGVQFLYSLAILLSTPLQLFPAIKITENELFAKSGKYQRHIKWEKNIFRFGLVMVTTLIAWAGAGDLDKFVALVGSFACVPLVYIYPVSTRTLSFQTGWAWPNSAKPIHSFPSPDHRKSANVTE